MLVQIHRSLVFVFFILFFLNGFSQEIKKDSIYKAFNIKHSSSLLSRVGKTPKNVLERFHNAGMNPREHILNDSEKNKVLTALENLPQFYKKILQKHLLRISFLDNMPNTALTTTINPKDSLKFFTITIRAEILNQTATEWLSKKEQKCFKNDSSDLSVHIKLENTSALDYVLLHEATHVLDGSLQITAKGNFPNMEITKNEFVTSIWESQTKLISNYTNKELDNFYYKTLQPVSIIKSIEIYDLLKNSPFVSLYSRNSVHEDLAEPVTLYHLAYKPNNKFEISIKRNGLYMYNYEPIKTQHFKKRIKSLMLFYAPLLL